MAEDLIDGIEKGIKKVSESLNIREVKEEHHSVPTAPRGHVSQVLEGKPKEDDLEDWARVERAKSERWNYFGGVWTHAEGKFKPVRQQDIREGHK